MQREESAMDLTKLCSPLLSVVESSKLSTSTVQAVVSSSSVSLPNHTPTSSQSILASPQATHRTVICSTVDNSGHRDRSASPAGIDLSVSSRRAQEVSVSAIIQPPTTTSRIEKVLRHYQAAAPMTLNGPDYLALYRRGSSGDEMKPSGIPVAPVLVGSVAVAAAGDTLDLRVARQPSMASTALQQQTQQTSSSGGAASSAAAGNTIGSSACSISAITSGAVKDFDPLMAPPPFPIQQPPVLTPPDQSPSERSDTMLEGEMIACFNVGGERRLCCPQVLHIVLSEFGQHEINSAFEELQINVSTASAEQMEVLKRTGDIPPTAPSCGLITKTDAHRLTSALLGSKQEPSTHDFTDYHFVLVYHDCFGKCVGRYVPELYLSPDAKCIQCDECLRIFSPQSFVSHSHRESRTNRTVHWGFDPNHWRHYLLPVEDLSTLEKYHISKNALHSSKRCSQAQEYRAPIPVCQGGREALKRIICEGKGVTPELEAVYNSKEMENIRTILDEMKTRFTRIATNPHDTMPISSGTSLLVSSKRKAISDSYRDVAYSLDSVKRIKTEPEATKSPALVSSLYPFLQSCLTTSTASTVPGFATGSNTILANWLTGTASKNTPTTVPVSEQGKIKSEGVSLLAPPPTASPLFPFGGAASVSGSGPPPSGVFNSTTGAATPSILDLLESSHKSAPLKSEFPVNYDNLAKALMNQKVKMPTAVPPTTSAMGLDPSNAFLTNAWLDAKIPLAQQRYYQSLMEKSGPAWLGLDLLKAPQTELIDLQTLQRFRPQHPPTQSEVPKVSEPPEPSPEMFSSAYYKSVIEIRLLQLKQSMNGSSHEAIERNLPMIDFLLNDTIKHLISQASNPSRSLEQLAEPLKTKIYELILQFIDQLYPSVKTEPKKEESGKSVWKVEPEEDIKVRVSPTVAVIKKSDSTEEMIDVVSNPDEDKREPEERRSPVISTHSNPGTPAKSSPAPMASPRQSDGGNSHSIIQPLSSASSSSSSASSLAASPSPPESSTTSASVKLGFSLSNAISCLRGAAAVAHHHREHHPTSNTSMLLTTGSPN